MNEKIANMKHRPGAMERLGIQPRQSRRELWIDVAKGISMLAVILGHQSQTEVSRVVFPFHLMMFFLLSGYTLKVKPVTGEYVAAKFGRLMKPYFFTCLAVMVLDVGNVLLRSRDLVTVTQQLADDLARCFAASGDLRTLGALELPSSIGAIWFFPAMFFAVIGAQLILNYVPKYRYYIGIGLMFLAEMSVSLGWMPFSIQSGMMAIFFLLLGHDIKSCDLLSKIRPIHYAVAVVLFVGGVAGKFTIYFVRAYMTDVVISSVVGLSGCLLVYGVSRCLSSNRLLAYTGQYSSYFLCIHLTEMKTIRVYFWALADAILQRLPASLLQGERIYGVVRFLLRVGIELVIIYVAAFCIVTLSKWAKQRNTDPYEAASSSRLASVDMVKGMLVVLMIVSYYPIADDFGQVVTSFYLLAFVVLSGMFFKPYTPLQRIKRDFYLLVLPYLLYSVGNIVVKTVIQGTSVLSNLKDAVLGMSASQRLLSDVASVGPASFLLMLVLARVGYSALQTYFPKQITILVVLGAVCGIWLGQAGLWLPWSLDVALYLLVPYHVGRVIRERDILSWVKLHPQCYFLLAIPWAYSVSCGGIDVGARAYSPYTYGLLGAVCATLLLYLLFHYVSHSAIPKVFQQVVAATGKYGVWVLISHALLEAVVLAPVLTKVTTRHNLFYLGVAIVFDVAVGCLLGWLYDKMTTNRVEKGGVSVARS